MFLLLLRSNKTHEGLNRSGAFIKKFIIEFAELCQKKNKMRILWYYATLFTIEYLCNVKFSLSERNFCSISWRNSSINNVYIQHHHNFILLVFFLFPRDASNIFRNNDQSFVEKLKKVVARKEEKFSIDSSFTRFSLSLFFLKIYIETSL